MDEKGIMGNVEIDHATPRTVINDREYTLVFPQKMFMYERPKIVEKLFVGVLTDKRKEFLNQFKDVTIIDSNRGRMEELKYWDEWYFNLMSSAKFVLCPDGVSYKWSYRFFEAVGFRAIPIIETEIEIYDGYKFFKQGDSFVYDQSYVDHNLTKFREEMML